ncbi:hypothetical protein [Streptomyces sp. NPDC088725]|uniref:hypothetical protein n=1 Tax=Streptomyces sp. NPDC088725 TaxID=3365873 RepID=UPI003817599C
MSEPNPYADGEYTWGPAQPQDSVPGMPGVPGAPGTPGYGYANAVPGYGYPAPAPGYGYPGAGPHAVPGNGMPLVSIGDITVVNDAIVTPAGVLPLRGAVWSATDLSRTEERIPPYAIVLAVVFFLFCFLGLLFLLMKEKTTTGFVQITVTSGGRHHATMVPATHPLAVQTVMGQIGYARSLSAM